eukprot:926392-Rhodomonas_salina.1
MPETDLAHAPTSCMTSRWSTGAVRYMPTRTSHISHALATRCPVLNECMLLFLRACYAMPGTDQVYATDRRHAVFGTELLYATTREEQGSAAVQLLWCYPYAPTNVLRDLQY